MLRLLRWPRNRQQDDHRKIADAPATLAAVVRAVEDLAEEALALVAVDVLADLEPMFRPSPIMRKRISRLLALLV